MLRAILIDVIPPTMTAADATHRLQEAESLVKTYGGVVLLKTIQKRHDPHYRTYIGSGKAEELRQDALLSKANIIIVNNTLKPGQIWNLTTLYEKEHIQVWDRIDLILKIFQKHASTKEAKLEIELASLRHMGPRIFGMGMELSRQGGSGKGGSAKAKGIGETNTEIMKRHLAGQEKKILKELEDCKRHRKLQQDARKRKALQTVGLIGYTNAGKSSLLNALTNKGALAADKLFATLDTRVGTMYVPDLGKEVLVSDTIGFIQDLPHSLIRSFHSTLAETINADLLLHVIDSNDPRVLQNIDVVHQVLAELGVSQKPMLYVLNKSDLISRDALAHLQETYHLEDATCVSAHTQWGLAELKQRIGTMLGSS